MESYKIGGHAVLIFLYENGEKFSFPVLGLKINILV